VACLAGLLFNADGAAHIADTQALGWRRTTARAAVAPFQAVSHALMLNRPRAWLAGAVGAPELLDAGHDPKAPPRPLAPAPDAPGTPTTTSAPPIVTRTPTAEDPLRVYLTGDSFLADVSRGLSATVGQDERWEPRTDAKPGTGLARPEVIDWPARIKARIPNDTEVVVLGFGGNDAQDMLADGGRVKLAEPEWEAEYQARIGRVLDVVERPGRTIVWVGVPVATAKNIEKARPAMTRAAKAELAKRPGALFLDTAGTLSGGDGRYKDLLTIDGEPKRVRASDGFHLSPAGATLLGRALERLISTVWPLQQEAAAPTSTSSSTPVSTP
ncbi:MAG: GDSL-type esterase/lipase family protein, partial [Acidimicrobiales bacterium]